jgi:hypothetical protein
MNEIPEDVMRAASRAYAGDDEYADQSNGAKLVRIARAILAERVRCAKIAQFANVGPGPKGQREIAHRIMNPSDFGKTVAELRRFTREHNVQFPDPDEIR